MKVIPLRCLMAIIMAPLYLVASEVSFLEEPIFNFSAQPKVVLKNTEGRAIECKLMDFDTKTRLIRVRLSATGKAIWMDPNILEAESKQLVSDWSIMITINGATLLRGKRIQTEDTKTAYDIEFLNTSDLSLSNLKAESRIYMNTSASGHKSGSIDSNELETPIKLLGSNSFIFFRSAAIDLNQYDGSASSKTTTLSSIGKITSSGITTGKAGDRLKGVAVKIYYKDIVVKEWYSSGVLKELVKW